MLFEAAGDNGSEYAFMDVADNGDFTLTATAGSLTGPLSLLRGLLYTLDDGKPPRRWMSW